ncbi:MAG: pyridoxamine 5'-phosphate oxidase family protein [Chitinophagaceae bacterium]
MDSINKNQPEHNRENLTNVAAVEKLKELVKKANTCFFCTGGAEGPSEGVRPMSVQKVDDDGHLWFLSANDSYKNKEIDADPEVKMYFQGSAHSDFLFIKGNAFISEDKNKIDELWEPLHKAWFTEGKNDPRISVIEIIPEEGYYWDTVHGNAVAFIKMLVGAAIGKTLDDSVEGKIKV